MPPVSPDNPGNRASGFPILSLWVFQAKVILCDPETSTQFSLLHFKGVLCYYLLWGQKGNKHSEATQVSDK